MLNFKGKNISYLSQYELYIQTIIDLTASGVKYRASLGHYR
jgi:hypothetical protein